MGIIYGKDGNKNGSEVKADTLQYLQLSGHKGFKLLVLPVILEFTREETFSSQIKQDAQPSTEYVHTERAKLEQ